MGECKCGNAIKYKCPQKNCSEGYCSAECCKVHKQTHEYVTKIASPVQQEEVSSHPEEVESTELSPEIISSLKKNSGLLSQLNDPMLQIVLRKINDTQDANEKETILDELLEKSSTFQNFSEKVVSSCNLGHQ